MKLQMSTGFSVRLLCMHKFLVEVALLCSPFRINIVLGNPRGNENAFLLSFGVVLFRWHNLIATYLHDSRPKWSGERIFQVKTNTVISCWIYL